MAVALRQPPEGCIHIQIPGRNTVPKSIDDAYPSMASKSRSAAKVIVTTVSMVLRLDGLTHVTIDCVSFY
jgi:hypothetical protein